MFLRHADDVVELHKTDTYKVYVEDVHPERGDLEDWLKLVRKDVVPCTEALDAGVELLGTCFLCQPLYDTN